MSGNGADLGQVVAMLNDVLASQGEMRAELRAEIQEVRAGLRAEIQELRAETRREFATVKRDLASLRQAVAEYHAAVLGHGVLISELEDRVRRIEDHLGLPAA